MRRDTEDELVKPAFSYILQVSTSMLQVICGRRWSFITELKTLLTQKLEKLQDPAGARKDGASYWPGGGVGVLSQELQEVWAQLLLHATVRQQIWDRVQELQEQRATP